LLQAIPLFEQGIAWHLPVAALHLGRIQMLRGRDEDARRMFLIAAGDESFRANRYLAHLFLGSIDERQHNTGGAEDHYRKALATLPGAQSARLALAALLARFGHLDEARRAIADAGPSVVYDPWWSFFRITPRERSFTLAELRAEVCR
jgi:Flp pilus assembly protein TadD